MIFPSVVVAGGRPEATHIHTAVDATAHAANVPYTFSGISFGSEHTRRYLVACVLMAGTFPANADTVTIGGVSAVQLGTAASKFWIAHVPTGTSGSVVATMAGPINGASVALWSVKKLRTAAATDHSNNQVPGFPSTIDIDVAASGVVLGCAKTANTLTWTGLDAGTLVSGIGVASRQFLSDQTVSVTTSGSTGQPLFYLVSLR